MTDNEITREKTFSEELQYFHERIKEVFDNYDNPNGYEDPLYIAVLRDSHRIVRKAEEEINCQKAENERLQKKVEELSEVLSESIRIRYKEAKSEAVKEFATRLEEYSYESMGNYGIIHMVVSVKDIDNLVKEMVSENDA